MVAAFQASVMTTCNALDEAQASQALQNICLDLFSAQPIPNYMTLPPPQSTPSTSTPSEPGDCTTVSLTITVPQTTTSTTSTEMNTRTDLTFNTSTSTSPTLITLVNTTSSLQSPSTAIPTTGTTTSRSGTEGENMMIGKELVVGMVVGVAVMTFVFAEF
jgi:hypothetical protein